jgi:phage terminase large subunit-like protein
MTEEEYKTVKADRDRIREQLRELEQKLHDKDPKGGGWNKKSIEEHLLDGTYRKDRHGELTPGTLGLKKPPGKITATVASQSKWIKGPADEHAVRNGCRFNEALAEYAADFFPKYLCHSKGQWAGEPFELNDFQRFEIIYPIFGWVQEDGLRRIRQTYIEMPKKVGKSTLASGIGTYMLVADEEPGAEIWSLGADRDQARVVHNEAINMIEASELLNDILKINHSNFNIIYKAASSWYKAMSSTPRGKQGANLHCAIVDELHEWYGTEMWERLRYAFRARQQPLLFIITNSGDDLQSVCYKQHQKARAVIDGAIYDDRYFAYIASVTQEEAESEIEAVRNGATELPVVRKCTPGLGTIIKESDLLADIRDAIQTPSEIPNLLRLTYGVWNTSVGQWLSTTDWAECGEEFTEEDVLGWECSGGIDLSKTGDMTALTMIFRDPEDAERYRQLAWFWMPQKTIDDRAHLVDYKGWVKDGFLRVCGERAIDVLQVEREVGELYEKFHPDYLAFDDHYVNVAHLEEAIQCDNFVDFPQKMMRFTGPTTEYERLIMSRKLKHNNNPILTWQAGHTVVKSDANKNIRPVKPKHGDIRTIDGIVSGIMALDMLLDEGIVYDEDSVVVI